MRNSYRSAFALVELLTALFIVCILVIALTTIYTSSVNALTSIDQKLLKGSTATELMQLIVDDITKASSADTDTEFVLKSKITDGVVLYRVEIASKIYDNAGKQLIYQKVIWQSDYDFLTGTISLYRCEGGMLPSDPVLDTQARENPDTDIFVPVCQGLTYFTIQIPDIQDTQQGEVVNYLDQWENDEMPGGVVVSLSFEQPVEYITGEVEVLPEDQTVESISLNRSKSYRFQFVSKDLDAAYGEDEQMTDEESQNSDETATDGEVSGEGDGSDSTDQEDAE